jgi:hypothetical protein
MVEEISSSNEKDISARWPTRIDREGDGAIVLLPLPAPGRRY